MRFFLFKSKAGQKNAGNRSMNTGLCLPANAKPGDTIIVSSCPEKVKEEGSLIINIYRTLYNDDRLPELVKEKGVNYRAIERITRPEDIVAVMNEVFQMDRSCEELFYVLSLNTKNKVNGVFEVGHGTLNATNVHLREIFIRAVLCQAAAIICVHNHPSGEPKPSNDDVEVTRRLVEAGRLLGIELMDHIIIGDDKFISLKSEGLGFTGQVCESIF